MKVSNSLGLSFDFLENGSVKCIEADPIRISLKATSPFSKSGTNIFLRKRGAQSEFRALTGPGSNSSFQFTDHGYIARGNWDGLEYSCMLQLSEMSCSWQWTVDIVNQKDEPVELDLIYLQDIGLKPKTDGLINEYYVSQYLERLVLEDQNHGAVICCRQNMKESVGNPWLMFASKNVAESGCVDGMQFYGKTYRETGIPEGLLAERLGGNYAGESSVIALQERAFILEKGGHHQNSFVATYLPDHTTATSIDDLNRLPGLLNEFNSGPDTKTPFLSFPRKREPDTRHPTPETRHPIPDTRYPIPQTQYPTPHTPNPIPQTPYLIPKSNLFNSSPFLPVVDLTTEELDLCFGKEKRHCEKDGDHLLSFFYGESNHVMLRTKEILADRPHAHIMQAKVGFSPDENIVSTTAFAFGVFNSHISQGNTNFGVLLSVCTSQFNVSPESGQRIFVRIDGIFYLLGVPSAFEMGLNHCRWIYKTGDHCFQIRTWTSVTSPRINMDFKVISGTDVRLLITHDFDTLNSWKIISGDEPHQFVAKPASDSMVSRKFPNARFRILVNNNHSGYRACGDEVLYSDSLQNGSLFILDIGATANFSVSFIGEVCSEVKALPLEDSEQQWLVDSLAGQSFWKQMSLNLSAKVDQKDAKAIYEILPWYGMNAITHFLTPYGLEQFSGAAWGTRDVAQGPLDLLLTLEKYNAARQALLIIFSNQNTNSGWPQWWMFDSFSEIRAQDSHGDVFYWVIIALSNYIKVTGDLKILEEFVPYYQENSSNGIEKYPVSEHIDRLIRMIINSFIPGTSLVPFGGGDWNDSLQPVSRELAESMISSWTVEMNYQAFNHYCAIYELSGDAFKAKELADICDRIKGDFNSFLVKDGVVAGYGLVNKDGSISVMLHPRDNTTGVHYSLLPMERGIISEIFTREQAEHHQELIEKYLKGPDGARLMDRPLKYQGGIQTIFQRAESSTFFGREIGLMYVHEHIRYAESLARTGRAEEFVKALRQAIPVEYREIVPCGDIRQSNCYYSSSDVAFKSRYEADEHYKEIQSGNITLRGGWRVYSSGPGIYVSMIVTRLLGLRIEFGKVIFDPVLPYSMDGMSASLDFMGHSVTFRYAVRESCHSPKSIDVNGKTMKFTLENNKYRTGGAVIPAEKFLAMLDQPQNVVDIQL